MGQTFTHSVVNRSFFILAAKRKRKNKVSRQPSYIRDLDDSSTTTEKSLEDFEVKVGSSFFCRLLGSIQTK